MLIADQVAIALNSVQLFEDTNQLNNVLSREVDQATDALQKANQSLQDEIAERKQAEQELIRTQRLRAVGELAAGVSHNLNNILTGIWVPAQMLQRAIRDPHLLHQADLINTFAERAADLVARLHQTTRVTEETDLQAVQVNAIIQEAIDTTRPRWKDEPESRNITNEIQTQLSDTPTIRGSASDLYDALVNLIFNAVDAMPQGGTISVSTQILDEQVQIKITDTGEGMDAETQQKVFEPFFTTKTDVGRGLGLSTVYNTITHWNGHMTVESMPNQGTTFVITLPICEEETMEEDTLPVASEGRRGRVLIVDDEPDIAEILLAVLQEEHDVDMANSGNQALERLQTNTYEVALLDLGMPGMSGDVLAEELRQINPNISLILTTGWQLPDDDPRLAEFDFWIQKPFRGFDRIRELVHQAIEKHDQKSQSQ